MEMELNKEELRLWQSVYWGSVRREETLEAVVPDTMPDVAELLDADAAVFLRNRETEDGAVTAVLQLTGTLLCRGEGEKGVFAVPLNASVSCRWEDAAIAREDQVQLRLAVPAADARLLNPRKLLLRCNLEAEAECFREEVLAYASGAESGELQQRRSTGSVSVVSAVGEKTFVITEEFPLSGAEGAESILHSRVQYMLEDVRNMAGKAVVQGKLLMEVLYTVPGQDVPCLQSFTAPFSQIVDAPGEVSAARFTLLPTAEYVESMSGGYGSGGFSLEAHLVAQVVFTEEKEITYLSDAYSTHCPVELERCEMRLRSQRREVTRHVSIRENVDLADSAERVLWCYVTAETPEAAEGGRCRLTAHAHVIYVNERGEIAGKNARLQTEIEGGEKDCCNMALLPQESYASPAGRGLEFRLGMEWRGWEDESWVMAPLSAVTLRDEEPFDLAARPSVTAVCSSDEDLWTLARRYASTVELIESANPGARESGGFLLIPRAR